MEQLPEEQRLSFVHGPFQLDESLSSEGVDKYNFLSNLIPPAALDTMIEDLSKQFKSLGMEMSLRGKMGNTAPAHCLMIWAGERCPQEQVLKLKDALFQIHCTQGRSMGDVDALVEAAAKAGLTDEAKIRKVLKDGKYASKLKKEIKHAKEDLKIHSVPQLMIEDVSGNQRGFEKETNIETVEGFKELIQECA
eukprot:scaffold7698_cov109-Cylindrotheca_fusiformis.AAC.4